MPRRVSQRASRSPAPATCRRGGQRVASMYNELNMQVLSQVAPASVRSVFRRPGEAGASSGDHTPALVPLGCSRKLGAETSENVPTVHPAPAVFDQSCTAAHVSPYIDRFDAVISR